MFKLAANACGTKTGVLPSLYDGVCKNGEVELTSLVDIVKVVGNVARILIAMSGAIAVIIIIVAALYYIVSIGDPGRIKKAKDMITNTTVGLVVIMSAYAVVTFIASKF
jgi:hypothetical protein